MARDYSFSETYRENLLKRIRALEAEIREPMEKYAVMEAGARERDWRVEKLKREMGVE